MQKNCTKNVKTFIFKVSAKISCEKLALGAPLLPLTFSISISNLPNGGGPLVYLCILGLALFRGGSAVVGDGEEKMYLGKVK